MSFRPNPGEEITIGDVGFHSYLTLFHRNLAKIGNNMAREVESGNIDCEGD